VRDVREEALARLLAVVRDVDPDLELALERARGGFARDARQLVGVDRLATAAYSAVSSRGRGRLPACVVRIRIGGLWQSANRPGKLPRDA
jgi:hypothetical protein